MSDRLVVVIGGHGMFGERIVASLQRHPEIELLVVGRRQRPESPAIDRAPPRYLRADIVDPSQLARVLAERPSVLIDTAGPFQTRDLRVASACASRGIHYIDIADGPDYVQGIARLDELAREHDALLVSGASTVPAVSTAIATDLAPNRVEVVAIDVGITPGQRAPRGTATVSAVLNTCGRPLRSLPPERRDHGFIGVGAHRYPAPVGRRLLSSVDTPERIIWPQRFPALERLTIRAGLELAPLHLGLNALSWLARIGLIDDLGAHAGLLARVARTFDRFGSEHGAMHVCVTSLAADGRRCREGTLVAEHGDGPRIPSTPAALVAKKLLALPGYTPLAARGSQPCVDLFSMAEFMRELAGRAIRYETADVERCA